MALYRNVHVSFWNDTKIIDEMTPEDRYFMLYLLSNPHTNQVGCYEISVRDISKETGYTEESIKKLLERFEKKLKVAKYIRLSREDGDKQESESIGNQRKIIERYLKEQDLNVIDEYVDDGVSGTSFDRPAFNRMIQDIEAR